MRYSEMEQWSFMCVEIGLKYSLSRHHLAGVNEFFYSMLFCSLGLKLPCESNLIEFQIKWHKNEDLSFHKSRLAHGCMSMF